jgi:biotin transport system substrate-specific component
MDLKPLTIRLGLQTPASLLVPRSCKTVFVETLGVVGLASLTLAGAHIRIPIEPVPITLQTLFVLLAGALAGSFRGFLSQTLYVTAGLLGVPLFAGAVTGLAALSGPTGGYLAGFVLAPFVVGKLIDRRAGFSWTLLVFSIGALMILALGVLHLALFYTRDVWTAIEVGLLPFAVGDAAKVFAAASIYGSYSRFRSRGR